MMNIVKRLVDYVAGYQVTDKKNQVPIQNGIVPIAGTDSDSKIVHLMDGQGALKVYPVMSPVSSDSSAGNGAVTVPGTAAEIYWCKPTYTNASGGSLVCGCTNAATHQCGGKVVAAGGVESDIPFYVQGADTLTGMTGAGDKNDYVFVRVF